MVFGNIGEAVCIWDERKLLDWFLALFRLMSSVPCFCVQTVTNLFLVPLENLPRGFFGVDTFNLLIVNRPVFVQLSPSVPSFLFVASFQLKKLRFFVEYSADYAFMEDFSTFTRNTFFVWCVFLWFRAVSVTVCSLLYGKLTCGLLTYSCAVFARKKHNNHIVGLWNAWSCHSVQFSLCP